MAASTINLDTIKRHTGTFAELHLPRLALHPVDMDRYAAELFYDVGESDLSDTFIKSFTNMQQMYFEHYKRQRGRRPDASSSAAIPMHPEYDTDVWKLFLGADKGALTYTDIDGLLLNTHQPDAELQRLSAARIAFHSEFLGGMQFKHVSANDVLWRVTAEHPVPWMIPVQFSWCNSRAVSPDTATLSEMYECSRIENTNKTLFDVDVIYKGLLQHLMYLEKHVMFDEIKAPPGTPCSIAINWFSPHYVLCKRCFETLVLYDSKIKWSMFLVFDRAFVDRNRAKIIVPKDTAIASLDGEVRPLDLFKEDSYALQLISKSHTGWVMKRKKPDKDEAQPADALPDEAPPDDEEPLDDEEPADADEAPPEPPVVTFLVNTLVLSEERPAVGGSGFFANTTCDESWFACTPHYVDDKRTGTIIANSENSYRHNMITTSRHLTGADIVSRHWADVPGMDTFYMLPVEWKYSRGDDGDAVHIACNCMTRCHKLPDKDKGKISVHPAKQNRPVGEWTAEKVRAYSGIENSKRAGILQYLNSYGQSTPMTAS